MIVHVLHLTTSHWQKETSIMSRNLSLSLEECWESFITSVPTYYKHMATFSQLDLNPSSSNSITLNKPQMLHSITFGHSMRHYFLLPNFKHMVLPRSRSKFDEMKLHQCQWWIHKNWNKRNQIGGKHTRRHAWKEE